MRSTRNSRNAEAVAPTRGRRSRGREAAAALNLWQALEHLAPQSPPAIKSEDCTWQLNSSTQDADMPWNDPRKREILSKRLGKKRRFLVHAGVVGGTQLLEAARDALIFHRHSPQR
ncbi:MAG: hypothetical protein RLZZ450_6827 [Pseudomonadota bacterium]|jgi:hypothetical protein